MTVGSIGRLASFLTTLFFEKFKILEKFKIDVTILIKLPCRHMKIVKAGFPLWFLVAKVFS